MEVQGSPHIPQKYLFADPSLKKLKDLSGHHIRLVEKEGSSQTVKVDSSFMRKINEFVFKKEYASQDQLHKILQSLPKTQLSLEQSNVGKLALRNLGKLGIDDTHKEEYL